MGAKIKNTKGAQASLIQLACRPEEEFNIIYALGFHASATAAKAISATVHASNILIEQGVPGLGGRRRYKGSPDHHFVTARRAILGGRQQQYLMVTAPVAGAEELVIGDMFKGGKEEQVIRILDLYTPIALLPSWGSLLWEAGLRHKVILPCLVYGFEWAAVVIVDDRWDEILDELAKTGQLPYIT